MQLREIDGLLEALGVKSPAELAALSDQQIAQTIVERGFGKQRIMSQVIFKDSSTSAVTLPLDSSFWRSSTMRSRRSSAVEGLPRTPAGTHV